MDQRRVALVTGGNRGIGLEVCSQLCDQGLVIFLGSRNPRSGKDAAAKLAGIDRAVTAVTLDVADPKSIDRCLSRFQRDAIHIDVLVNNAGTYPQGDALSSKDEHFRETMEVHYFGALRLCRLLIPGMQKRRYGRIVNVSSGSGSFGEGLEGPAAYCISKAAMNAMTVKLSQVAGPYVKVNTMCPGWVRTRMGGPSAPVSPEKGAETIVWLATLPENGPTGGYFRNRKRIAW